MKKKKLKVRSNPITKKFNAKISRLALATKGRFCIKECTGDTEAKAPITPANTNKVAEPKKATE